MNAETYKSELERERRARLAATQLFEQKHASLQKSHKELSLHSRKLAEKVVDQRTLIEKLETEKQIALDEAAQAKLQLEKRPVASADADYAKSMFLTKMSHEFRTPLNGVINMAELLCDRLEDDELKTCATSIKTSGDRLLNFTGKLLDFASLRKKKTELKSVEVNIRELFEDTLVKANGWKKEKPIEISLDILPNVPERVWADRRSLELILQNLVENAVLFTEEGFVHVGIGCRATENPELAEFFIWVEDSGIGIEVGQHDHILGDFNQAEDGKDRTHDGAGIGLSIVTKLASMMDGELTFESIKDSGSRFEISVMLKVQERDMKGPEPNFTGAALIASDDILHHTSLSRLFELLGIEADEVESVPPELESDIRCAFVTGCLIEEFNAAHPDFPTVLLSNCSSEETPKNQLQIPATSQSILKQLQNVLPKQRIKVLAAEDNKTNQLVFKSMLKNLDIDLKIVDDGEKAVAEYHEFQPDLIFMDISMPKMDGMEATQQIRWFETEKQLQPITIIAMTAHVTEGDEARIYKAGVDEYLTKPLKKAEIVSAVEAKMAGSSEAQKAS